MNVTIAGGMMAAALLAGPAPGAPPLGAAAVKERLLAVTRATAPFRIVDGSPDGVDLVAEWKIVDAEWNEIFARAGLKEVFRIFMKLDEPNHQVRAQDHYYSVEWRKGVPLLVAALTGEGNKWSRSTFKGQMYSYESGKAWAFTEDGGFGQVYKYRFNTSEMKGPIKDAVTACGWKYKGVAFGKP